MWLDLEIFIGERVDFICVLLCINFELFLGEISSAATPSLWSLLTGEFELVIIVITRLLL